MRIPPAGCWNTDSREGNLTLCAGISDSYDSSATEDFKFKQRLLKTTETVWIQTYVSELTCSVFCIKKCLGFCKINSSIRATYSLQNMLRHILILRNLVLGEEEEVFAQWAGELWHFLAAVVGGAGRKALPLLNAGVDLQSKRTEEMGEEWGDQMNTLGEPLCTLHMSTGSREPHLHQNVGQVFVFGMKAEGCV